MASDLALCAVMVDARVLPAPMSRTTSALTAEVSQRRTVPRTQLRIESAGGTSPGAMMTNGA
jgi:hypothetical protein